VDKNAQSKNAAEDLQETIFFGRLDDIYVVTLPPIPALDPELTSSSQVILAGIRNCKVTSKNGLGMSYYENFGRYEVVDIECVQCVVGRVLDRGSWAIIDRTGSLELTSYDPSRE
jgi:hypothetical protein